MTTQASSGRLHEPLTARTFPARARDLARDFDEFGFVLDRWGLPPFWTRPAGVDTLFRIIIEQQISVAAANTVYRRMRRGLGALTAGRVASAGESGLRAMGLSRQKARYCHSLARAVTERRFSVAGLARLDDDEAATALQAQPGIGPWSASLYLMSALKRMDVWPSGDLALLKGIAGLLPDADAVHLARTGDRWRPRRAVAARLVWHYYRCALAGTTSPSVANR
ncbi:MAG: DNA-3-methyladenine glycosylase 2 family protein [Gemmatimonadetes bacterium]|nr:DNA-3-methyladenine glycosylase 2 family protein [Gemmatimonadota bacterium]